MPASEARLAVAADRPDDAHAVSPRHAAASEAPIEPGCTKPVLTDPSLAHALVAAKAPAKTPSWILSRNGSDTGAGHRP